MRACQSSLEFTYMELEFIRVVAEEALAKMAHGNDLGICSLLGVITPRLSDRSCFFLHFSFLFSTGAWRLPAS